MSLVQSTPQIFDIYREPIEVPLDPLHCESMVERSAKHNWRIEPHRHEDLAHFFFVRRGKGVASLDMADHALTTPCVMVIPARSVHGFSFSRDIDGHVISLREGTLSEHVEAMAPLREALSKPRVLSACARAEDGDVAAMFDLLALEYASVRPARQVALAAHLSMILVWVARTIAHQSKMQVDTNVRRNRHASRFLALVEAHFRNGATLEFYAAQLEVSPTHLNNICRAGLGRTAKRIINERLYLEARRNLVFTTLTINEIAVLLGFSDPAYFTRFFTRHSGMSPSAFRRAALATTPQLFGQSSKSARRKPAMS